MLGILHGRIGRIENLNYTCPYCHYSPGALIFIGAREDLDHLWETDQVCGVCDGDVTVEVRDTRNESGPSVNADLPIGRTAAPGTAMGSRNPADLVAPT